MFMFFFNRKFPKSQEYSRDKLEEMGITASQSRFPPSSWVEEERLIFVKEKGQT